MISDSLISPSAHYDNLRPDFKADGDYAVVSSSVYAAFPILTEATETSDDKVDEPPPLKPFYENEYVKDKPPLDLSKKKRMTSMYSQANNHNKKIESNYDNL